MEFFRKNGSFNKVKKKSKNCEYIDIITSNNENTNKKPLKTNLKLYNFIIKI